jgi:hypothetical protein
MKLKQILPAVTLATTLIVPTSVGHVPEPPVGDTPERRSPALPPHVVVSSFQVYATAGRAESRLTRPAAAIHKAAEAVAWCESKGDYRAQNPSSTASGKYQFIDGTWQWVWETFIGEPAPTKRAKQAEPHDQDRAFAALWSTDNGKKHWSETRECWENKL